MLPIIKPDWIRFLHQLGMEIHRLASTKEGNVSAFLSVPFIDYAGVLAAAGILTAKYRAVTLPFADPNDWKIHNGKPVSFPFELRDGGTELKRKVGTIDGVEDGSCGPRLSVRYLDNLGTKSQGRQFTRYVQPRWLHAVQLLDEMPDLEALKPGSRLASNIQTLDALLGETGAASLVGKPFKDCLIVDIKNRIADELKDTVELKRFGVDSVSGSLVLADLLRPDGWGPEAMKETYSSCVAQEPDTGWENTIICGSLNFLKYWDECDSSVRIAILSPTENAYDEAVAFVNNIYYQRSGDVPLPAELLALKPAIVDFQLIVNYP